MFPSPPPSSIGIIGLGLIGASVALAARRRWPDARVVGVDRMAVLRHPRLEGVLDIRAEDAEAAAGVDVMVLAAPVGVIRALVADPPAAVRDATLVIDTGSTKAGIVAAARRVPGFVGGHPMAGAAVAGPDLAQAGLFDDATWFLTPATGSMGEAEAFVRALGARPVAIDADRHDELVAAISHVPQVVASVLLAFVAERVGPEGLARAGAGLRDTTRLAASPPGIWTDILASNATAVAPLLEDLATRLRTVADTLDDRDAIVSLFDTAAAAAARLATPSD